jgi:hypothetical protein
MKLAERRMSPGERRRGRRAPFVASVKQSVGRDTQLALAQDLGELGMQLRRLPGPAYLPRTPLTLTFELPDGGELIQVRGQVAFERAEGNWQTTGVRFEAISLADRARIARFLDSKLR